MSVKLLAKPTVIHLSRQKDRRFVVPTQEGDSRWTEKQLIEACETWEHAKKVVDKHQELRRQLNQLAERLSRWLNENSAEVEDAYLQVRPDRILFLVVLSGDEYNPQVETALTELSFEVGNDPSLAMVRLDIQSLPRCDEDDVRSFIDQDGASDDGELQGPR